MYGFKKLKMKFITRLIIVLLTMGCSERITNKENLIFQGNHLAVMVNNLKVTGDFYSEILKIEEIDIKSTGLTHRWFKLNDGFEVHLVKSIETLPKKNRNNHLAIQTDDINAMVDYLQKEKIEFSDWFGNINKVQERFDGVLQVYIEDPEGNWIEINQKSNENKG